MCDAGVRDTSATFAVAATQPGHLNMSPDTFVVLILQATWRVSCLALAHSLCLHQSTRWVTLVNVQWLSLFVPLQQMTSFCVSARDRRDTYTRRMDWIGLSLP